MQPAARLIDGKDLICRIGDLGHVGSNDAVGGKCFANGGQDLSHHPSEIIVVCDLGCELIADEGWYHISIALALTATIEHVPLQAAGREDFV